MALVEKATVVAPLRRFRASQTGDREVATARGSRSTGGGKQDVRRQQLGAPLRPRMSSDMPRGTAL
jgi:hypothetical protein